MFVNTPVPANTKHLYNICSTSAQPLRRRSSSVQMLYKCLVFIGVFGDPVVVMYGCMIVWPGNGLTCGPNLAYA